MSIVYINLHPEYDYATAVISGFVEFRQYVADNDFVSWVPVPRGGRRQLMIKRTAPENVDRFIGFVQQSGCEVKIRDERNDEWHNIGERPTDKENP